MNKTRKRKDIRGATVNKKAVLLISLGVLVVLLAAGLLTLFLCGFRYLKVTYRSLITGQEQKISFIGFTERSGALKAGRLNYDNRKASVKKNDAGLYVITYNNGDVYEGEMDGLQRQGRGVMTYVNGDRYEGGFAADRFEGKGVYEYGGGDRYEGSFSGGKKSGEGRYVWMLDGVVTAEYTGSFKNDRRDGEGVFRSSDGAVYKGAYVNDLREDDNAEAAIPAEGGGTDHYYGSFKNDVRSGRGCYYYADGNVYAGGFENNKPEGEGVICFADGTGYKGIFRGGNLDRDSAVELTVEQMREYLASFGAPEMP